MKSSRILYLVVFLSKFCISFSVVASFESMTKSHGYSKKSAAHEQDQQKSPQNSAVVPVPYPLPGYGSFTARSTVFSPLAFGAKGDGVADDSLVDGTLLAPARVSTWSKSSPYQWLNFKWVHNFTIKGTGFINGQGSQWWHSSPQLGGNQALRFYAGGNITVRDITIMNSALCHLKFDSCVGVEVNNVSISSPETSPNTDGIHLQNTRDTKIHNSNIACGDDCISIQTGCSNLHVHHINCGPGHGISIGGLGKDNSLGCVSNIKVENIYLQNTLSGVRIKTWQGGAGTVKNVSFYNIRVSNVAIPVVIDQFYCDKSRCRNQTRAVAISDVSYNQIIGTYSVQPMHLACSDDVPCTGVDLTDVRLKTSSSSYNQGFLPALCWNSYGKSQPPLLPSSIDDCLRRNINGDLIKKVERSHDSACQ
ncbi:hypothetical protein Nepgr_022569 [Nepenthes gracilis]|uniref:Polygalacturonase n=1 Tax=Nepenthes gracilis TaxID=150966 RepID=A0AAD3XWX8_NEPGR|nr:hypothetical protein Nepgr_022569 [Nepenthes gracilis]